MPRVNIIAILPAAIGRFLAGIAALLALGGGAAAKPLVVLLADAEGTVAPDLLVPYAILADSGAVEVKIVSATMKPVRLTPGVAWVAPQMTLAQLARERPGGPDVVIVPALEVVHNPQRSAWLRAQVRGGARIMSICNGAKVLAAAGLLDGRQATVHWYSRAKLARQYPKVTWRRDLRWVTDGPITTTAGISAAEPASLNLLRELAGEAAMRETARRMRLPQPDQHHRGDDFHLTARGAGLVVANRLAFWRHEDVAAPLFQGVDERALGTALDAWSRTYRSTAWAVGPARVISRHGLLVYRGRTLPARFNRQVALPPADVMEATFEQIRLAYGAPTARFVALQFEHPYGVRTPEQILQNSTQPGFSHSLFP
jgi:putative intracellular protease/amidase